MLKRGQVTVFLIIGIIILFIVGSLLWFVNYNVTTELIDQYEIPASLALKPKIDLFMANCLLQTMREGMFLLGVQGGIIYPDGNSAYLLTENALINYGYLNGISQFSEAKIEQDLRIFIIRSLPSCLHNFTFFREQGILIRQEGEIDLNLRLREHLTEASLTYPLIIQSGEDELRINSFTARLPFSLRKYFNLAEVIAQEYGAGSFNFPELARQDAFITIMPYDKTTTVFSIYDQDGYLKSPYLFLFAIRDNVLQKPPEIEFIPDALLKEGELFIYDTTVASFDERSLQFAVEPSFFLVSNDGVIEGKSLAAGEYTAILTARDGSGQEDQQSFTVIVEPGTRTVDSG
ncbi:MAG: Ig domain-containing protein [Nanoarchaeota archaeon]|nr:Ig domain-containing protein [Nanoarchaeota archaeon]